MNGGAAARDPQVIMRRLPEEERDYFLARYRTVASAAVEHETGYKALQRFLDVWRIGARAQRPSSGEVEARVQEIRDGAPTVPIEDVFPRLLGMSRAEAVAWWQQRVEQAVEGR